MTGFVTNIQRYSLNDGNGIRTVVFLKGCPLRCPWCANPETQARKPKILFNSIMCMGCGLCVSTCPQHAHGGQCKDGCRMCLQCVDVCPKGAIELVGREMDVEQVMEEVEKDIPFYEHSGGGLTLSGGEVLFQPEFALELLQKAKSKGISCAVETSGYAEQSVAQSIFDLCDQILFDVKHMDSNKHKEYIGQGNERILENLSLAAQKYPHRMIVRVPLIEGFNCTEDNLEKTVDFCVQHGIPQIDLLPYHELGKHKYVKLGREYTFAGKTPDQDRLNRAKELVQQAGLICRING